MIKIIYLQIAKQRERVESETHITFKKHQNKQEKGISSFRYLFLEKSFATEIRESNEHDL